MRNWPLLLVTTVLLFGASLKVAVDGDLDRLSIALLTAGLISLGAWLAVEIRNIKDRGE